MKAVVGKRAVIFFNSLTHVLLSLLHSVIHYGPCSRHVGSTPPPKMTLSLLFTRLKELKGLLNMEETGQRQYQISFTVMEALGLFFRV